MNKNNHAFEVVESEKEYSAEVIVMSKSVFAGCKGKVTGQCEAGVIKGMLKVTLTTAGRLYENIPFLPSELHFVRFSEAQQ